MAGSNEHPSLSQPPSSGSYPRTIALAISPFKSSPTKFKLADPRSVVVARMDNTEGSFHESKLYGDTAEGSTYYTRTLPWLPSAVVILLYVPSEWWGAGILGFPALIDPPHNTRSITMQRMLLLTWSLQPPPPIIKAACQYTPLYQTGGSSRNGRDKGGHAQL
ncbi:hypothetical protein EI94DRAFT_1701790 [Lactarius quietus]|nr:hypothetical protein EI94DRAFT_1701790 [Lactarius quietus]